MPNTEVKLLSADGSWIYVPLETLPGKSYECDERYRDRKVSFYAQNKTEGLMKSINQNVVALRRVSV